MMGPKILLLFLVGVKVTILRVARSALPMGVALEAIVEYLYLSISSEILGYL
jgi:hypothetical protein